MLELPPGALNILCVCSGLRIDEVIRMVNSEMMPVVTVQLLVSFPTVSCDGGLTVNVLFDYADEFLAVSFVVGVQCYENFCCFLTNTANNPLSLDDVSFVIFSFAEFRLVDFHCAVSTADFSGGVAY